MTWKRNHKVKRGRETLETWMYLSPDHLEHVKDFLRVHASPCNRCSNCTELSCTPNFLPEPRSLPLARSGGLVMTPDRLSKHPPLLSKRARPNGAVFSGMPDTVPRLTDGPDRVAESPLNEGIPVVGGGVCNFEGGHLLRYNRLEQLNEVVNLSRSQWVKLCQSTNCAVVHT